MRIAIPKIGIAEIKALKRSAFRFVVLAAITVLGFSVFSPAAVASNVVTGIQLESATTSSLTIKWNRHPGAVKYRVYTTPTSSMPSRCEPHCRVITPNSQAAPSFTLTGLAPNTSHYVKVSAIASNGRTITGWQSSSVKMTTSKSSGEVTAPSTGNDNSTSDNTTVSQIKVDPVTESRMTVKWSKYPGAVRYRVYASPTSKMPSRCEPHCKVVTPESQNSPSETISGLNPETSRYIKISAINAQGKTITGWQDVPFKATTTPDTSKYVGGIRATSSSEKAISVAWDPYPNAVKYRVYATPTSSMPSRCEPHCTVITPRDENSPSHTLVVPKAETERFIKISAINKQGKTISSWQSAPVKAESASKSEPIPTPSPEPTPEPTPSPSPDVVPVERPNVPAHQLNASTTGVPAGTNLTLHTGVLKITKDGTVINGLDVKGSIKVNANNVTIKNTRVRGQGSVNIGLINVKAGMTGLKVIDTEIYNEKPHQDTNGIMGANFTLERVNIHHVVDQVHVTTLGNVKILHSWLHSNTHFKNDPNWNGGPSHDDNIQLIGGSNVLVKSSRIEGAKNAAIMVGQNHAPVKNLRVEGNLIRGGWCSINIAPKGHGNMEGNGNSITGNVFHHDQTHTRCAVIAPNGSVPQMTSNKWSDTGAEVIRTRG